MSHQSLSVFQFHTHSLRVFPTDDGLSFVAVAKDVARALGYRDAANFLRQVPESHRGTRQVSTPSGVQEMRVVDEAGLYRGVLRSEKPEAEPFMEWITAEVLPSIRRTGGYVREGAAQLAMAQELGALRDELRTQNNMILALYGQLDGARRGHVRALTTLAGIHKRQAAQEAKALVLTLEAAGVPRDEIARRTGKTLNHIRQIVHRDRHGRAPQQGAQGELGLEG
ncbi:Bro-N domain-containing protein [Thauera mechernichensis]|uniref:Bro-N domain-containing protein n=1 Tax=Thauera mechernichensis TaxID=82788 RepID=A0ABW3WIF4_9RHOO|nr:BRO family protein [Thauera mechernichensis]MDG3063273.1 BRO family protein [Thauera mechernichensis]